MVDKIKKLTLLEWIALFGIITVLYTIIHPKISSDANKLEVKKNYAKIKGNTNQIKTITIEENKNIFTKNENTDIISKNKTDSSYATSSNNTKIEEKKEIKVPEMLYNIFGENGINHLYNENPKLLDAIMQQPDNAEEYVSALIYFIGKAEIDNAIKTFSHLWRLKNFEKIYFQLSKENDCVDCQEYYQSVFLLLSGKFSEAEENLKNIFHRNNENEEVKKWLEYLESKKLNK